MFKQCDVQRSSYFAFCHHLNRISLSESHVAFAKQIICSVVVYRGSRVQGFVCHRAFVFVKL